MTLENNATYYIQQVADITGLSRQVIRKWEERHDLIKPARLPNGYRVYSESDINRLLAVKSYARQGYSLKDATILVEQNTLHNIDKIEDQATTSSVTLNRHVFLLLESGTRCDELEIHLILQQAYYQLGLDSFLTTVIIPYLEIIGTRWENKEWDEYQEAVSSLVIRDFLVQIRRNYRQRDHAKVVLGACLPFEQHDIPLIILLLQFMINGWKTILVGASPAPCSINALVARLKPDLVVLSATTSLPFEMDPNLLTELDLFAAKHRSIPFYLGGSGSTQYMQDKQLKTIKVAKSLEEILNG